MTSLFNFFKEKYQEAYDSQERKNQVRSHLKGIEGLSDLISGYYEGNLHN